MRVIRAQAQDEELRDASSTGYNFTDRQSAAVRTRSKWVIGTRLSSLVVVVLSLVKCGTDCSVFQNQPVDDHATFPSESDHRVLRQKSQHQRHHQRELNLLQRDFVDCSKYQYTQSITDKLRLNFVVNVDESNPGRGTFSAEMVYQGDAWLGVAHSESGAMMNSMAVLGLPDAPASYQVQKYKLGTPDKSSIPQALPALQQTLLDTELIQDGGNTIMRFTKLLSEPDELTIQPNWQNTFLFAHGTSNTLGYHERRGVLALDLRPCIPTFQEDTRPSTGRLEDVQEEDRMGAENSYVISIGGFGDNSGNATDIVISVDDTRQIIYPTEEPVPVEEGNVTLDDDSNAFADSENQKPSTSKPQKTSKTIWMLHGIFATLTCGVLLPAIIASSILHGCFGGKVKQDQVSNNRIYRWANLLVVVAVIATFVTAVVGATIDSHSENNDTEGSKASSSEKPTSYHSPAGLALFIVFLFFALSGALRSYLILTPKGFRELSANKSNSTPSDFNSVDAKSVDKSLVSLARIFDNSHRLVGIILVFVSCWQCKTGLMLFGERFHDSWFNAAVFWGISGPIIGVIGFLCVLQMCYQMVQWSYNAAYW